MDHLTIRVNGKEYSVQVEESPDGTLLVHCGKDTYVVETKDASAREIYQVTQKQFQGQPGQCAVIAPLPGVIHELKVKRGDPIRQGQSLAKLVAMKMENDILAPRDGVVREIRVKRNDTVQRGDVLIVIG